MKTKTTCLLLLTGLLAGCWQKSVSPFYTAKDVVAESKLAGVWREPRDPNETAEDNRATWEFTRGDDKRFDLVIWNKEDRQEYDAYVFKLGDERYLDIGSKSRAISTTPVHHLFKLISVEPELKLAALNTDWMQKWLRNHPESIAHVAVIDPEHREDRDKDELVLTASTKSLQAFVRQHAAEENFFAEPTVFRRHSNAVNTRETSKKTVDEAQQVTSRLRS